MSADQIQQHLIDQAHASRRVDKLPSGESTLTFVETDFGSLGLALLAKQRPDLKGLYLMRTRIQDEGFEAINGFQELEELNLTETGLGSDAILKITPSLPIKLLKIDPKQISVLSLAHIAKLSSLRDLSIGKVVTHSDCLSGRWPGLAIDDALLQLAPLVDLEKLSLWGQIIKGPGLTAMSGMKRLKTLALSESMAPAHGLADLKELDQLEVLLLRNTGLDDDALRALTSLTNLRQIDVSSTYITDSSVETLMRFTNLKAIGFEKVRVHREVAANLLNIPGLEHLEIYIEGVKSDYWYDRAPKRKDFMLEA